MNKGRRKMSDTVHALNESGAALCGRVTNPNKLAAVEPETKISCPSCKLVVKEWLESF